MNQIEIRHDGRYMVIAVEGVLTRRKCHVEFNRHTRTSKYVPEVLADERLCEDFQGNMVIVKLC